MWPIRAPGNTVSVINTTTGAVDKTLTVGSQPSAVAVSPATNGPTVGLAYVTNRASGTVSMINTANNTVVGSAIRVGSSPQDVAVAHTPTARSPGSMWSTPAVTTCR